MFFLVDSLKSFIYDSKRSALKLLNFVLVVNLLLATAFLVLRYGFYYNSREAMDEVFELLDYNFWIFSMAFAFRLLFEDRVLDTLKNSWFETSVHVFSVLHLIFDYKIQQRFLKVLGLVEQEGDFLSYQYIVSLILLVLMGIELVRFSAFLGKLKISFAATFLYSFIFLILLGAFALTLPAMTEGKAGGVLREDSMPFLDALFTSASAACVTGLALEHTGSYFTLKGQLVILLLIQIGGIGIVSFATFFATFLSKGVGIKQQSMIQDYLNSESLAATKGLLRKIVFITLLVESLGAVFIFYSWGQEVKFPSTASKVYFSVFHSISAFCNAGFSLFGGGLYTDEDPDLIKENGLLQNSLASDMVTAQPDATMNVKRMYSLHFIVAWIIVLGGIGFSTLDDLWRKLRFNQLIVGNWNNWNTSTIASVNTTILLVVMGTVGFLVLEFEQMRDRNIFQALNTAFFQSVTCRTAGFNTIDFSSIHTSTAIMCIFLMFIGASPGSCGGGVKTSTFYLILLSSIANISGHQRIVLGRRTIPQDLVIKAFAVFIFAATYNIIIIFLLSITESHLIEQGKLLHVVFEAISAFTTTGLSMGITAELSDWGKILITLSMYIGRVGTLTLAVALSKKAISTSYQYPEGYIMVG
jgi:Trk-type K+ transport system membrane component